VFAPFQFEGIEQALPNTTFEGEFQTQVGSKKVQLFEVGPAHTRGDTLVYVSGDRTVFTGDVLFMESHPIMWAGPVSNWIRACDIILGLDVETIVPGHGPVTDKQGVRHLKGYFEYLFHEVCLRHQAGLSVLDAAKDIAMDAYVDWIDRERIVANVDCIYRELNGEQEAASPLSLFGLMETFSAQSREGERSLSYSMTRQGASL